jgi:DNA polymerase-3 subunit delta
VQVSPEQLPRHLDSQLAPVYFISGDDPLRVMEAADAVRTQARNQGFDEREVLTVEPHFDWNNLTAASGNLSLFSEKRLIDLRLPTGKPGKEGAQALRDFATGQNEDTLLLITAGKLDTAARKSKWVQALDKAGVVVLVWPLDADKFPAWMQARMQRKNLAPTREAVTLLAERMEGNLLACVQEIDKLYLLHGEGKIDVDDILEAVSDNSRFDVFDLAESVLAGDAARSCRILNSLKGEGVEPVLVLWSLAKDIRQLLTMADHVARGEPVAKVLTRYRVWQNRKAVFSSALNRLPVNSCRALLQRCAVLDRIIKGQAAGNPWDELLQLSLQIAGAQAVSS